MKRFLALALALVMVLAIFSGCKKAEDKDSTPVGRSSTDISGYFASSPETIDPTMNSSMDGSTYLVHLFQGLYRFKWDATGVEPGDAESATVSDDGLTWTFKLRAGLKWSDGTPITAQDYEYSWKRVCDSTVAAPYGGDMGAFLLNGKESYEGEADVSTVGVKALDSTTFEVKLSGPCPFFDQIAAFPVFYPVRQEIIEEHGDSWWTKPETYISNGPFKMKSFTLDKSLVVVPNENYYDVSKVVPTSITFQFLADENAALAALRAKEIDISNQSPPEEATALKEEGLLDVRDQLGTYYISYNTQVAPFDNPLVRKALTLAIDRDYLSNTVMQGTRTPATAMVCGGFTDSTAGSDFREVGGDFISLDYEANKAAAKQALADAGYPNGEGFPTVEYIYNTSSVHQPIAEVIAQSWKEVLGINVNIVNQEWNTFLDTRRKGNFSVARNGWVSDWNDPSSMLTIFYSNGGNNDGKYSNTAFDSYMDQSYASGDTATRMAALHNAEKTLMEDWGCGPLMFYKQSFIVDPALKDWYYMTLGYTMLHTAHKEAAK